MSCAKFEPQWAYEWQISDSVWAQMILKLAKDRTVSANTENMLPDRLNCALSACLSAKQMQLYLITEDSAPHLSVTKATEQTWACL